MSIKLQKTWVRIGNTYCLLIEAKGRIFTKKFRVLHYNADVVKLNKRLKEYDLIDTIKHTLKIDKMSKDDIYNSEEWGA